MKKRPPEFVVPVALLCLHAVLAVSSLRRDSLTFDEPGHLTGGATSWLEQDHRLFPQNGQFPKRWAALGALLAGARLPPLDQVAWQRSDVDRFGHQFLYSTGNDLPRLLFASRLMMVVLELCLGLVVYCWSRSLFGRAGACVSLTLFTFSPALLAHGRLATSDTAAALAFLLAVLALWRLLHGITLGRIACCSLSVGLLLISKMSGLLILPIAALLLGRRLAARLPLPVQLPFRRVLVGEPARQLAWLGASGALATAGAVLMIWAAYDFRYSAFTNSDPARDRFLNGESIDQLTDQSTVGPLIRFARDHELLPEAYLFGVAHVLRHSDAHPAFMNGSYSLRGWWQFHPYCVLMKTPLAVFVVAGVAIWTVRRRGRCRTLVSAAGERAAAVDARVIESLSDAAARREPRPPTAEAARREPRPPAVVQTEGAEHGTAPLWVFLLVYWLAAIGVHLSIGERHVLPTYPAAFILCGAAGRVFGTGRRVAAGVLVAALGWLAVESLGIWPHYLSYFNQLAGGPRQGYQRLVDSNCDWGQDLERLRLWLEERRREDATAPPVSLCYFGSADPTLSGIDAILLPGYFDWRSQLMLEPLRPGTYVISATMLQSVYNPAFGPWSSEYERLFEQYAGMVEGSYGRPLPLDGLRPGAVRRESKLAYDFERLRAARLFATLREREPDARIGYSLLVYEVTAEELAKGARGP